MPEYVLILCLCSHCVVTSGNFTNVNSIHYRLLFISFMLNGTAYCSRWWFQMSMLACFWWICLSLDEAADWWKHQDQTSFSRLMFSDVATISTTNELKLTASNSGNCSAPFHLKQPKLWIFSRIFSTLLYRYSCPWDLKYLRVNLSMNRI